MNAVRVTEEEFRNRTTRGFAACGVLDAADQIELFAAALQFGFDFRNMLGGHDQDHAHAQIEGLQEFVALDPSRGARDSEKSAAPARSPDRQPHARCAVALAANFR